LVQESYISKNIRGIKGIFLIKNGKVLESDFRLEKDVEDPFEKITSLVLRIHDEKGDIKRISIFGNNQLQIYFHSPSILGIVTLLDVNFPVLDIVAKRVLKAEEFVDFTVAQLEDIRGKIQSQLE
jgi:hypothetical protein